MDIRALSQGSSGAGSLVSALPEISSDSRAVVTSVAQASGLTDSERTQLVQAVAAVESGISTASLREEVLAHVSGLGVYLENTSDEGWPRWNVLTALRVYGLNLSSEASQPKQVQPDEQAVARQVNQQLEGLARKSRGVSLEHAVVAVKTAKAAKVEAPKAEGGHKVEVVA